MLVVVPPQDVPALALQGLLDNQAGRKLHKLRTAVRRRQTAFNQIGQGLAGAHRRG